MNFSKLALASISLALCSASLVASLAEASAPMEKVTPPGVYRVHVGAFEVNAISDGTIDLPMSKLLIGVKPKEFKQAVDKQFLKEQFETSVNSFLINTGAKLVLVDAGAGTLFGPTLGKMLTNLKAAGYQPDQVDAVVLTHMHPDHVGGLSADQKMVFPNATVYADQAEIDYWLNQSTADRAPKEMKDFFQGAMASLLPYQKAGKLKPLPADGNVVTGISAKATHGHTAGHTIYAIESEGVKLVLLGDLVHMAAVQFSNPNVAIQFDTDAKSAIEKRKAAFAEAAKEGYIEAVC